MMHKTSRQEIENSLKLRNPSEVNLLILMHPTEIMSLVTDPDQSRCNHFQSGRQKERLQ